jgi:small subunit ribosomal protein S4
VSKNQKIEVKEKSRKSKRIQESLQANERRGTPKWLSLEAESLSGIVLDMPRREDITDEIQEQLIVELYSK